MATVVTAMALSFGVAGAGPVHAQNGPPVAAPGSQLRLTSQSSWVTDGDAFQVGLAVTTADPSGARLQLTVFDPLQTRSDFTASLSDRMRTGRFRVFEPVPLNTLGATPQLSIAINPKTPPRPATKPAASIPPSLKLSTAGVYPVRVDLYSGQGTLLDRLDTHLVYVGGTAGLGSRLDVALVVPIHASPALTADAPGALPTGARQDLAALTAALVAHSDAAVTVAPTPQTVDALQNGTATEKTTVSQLAQVLGRSTVQNLTSPYVRLDLPAMLNAGLEGEITTQQAEGAASLAADVHITSDPAVALHTGPLSSGALDDLSGRGVRRLVVRDNLLNPLPADQSFFTPAQPFALVGKSGRQIQAVAVDSALAAHFSSPADPVLAAHQLLADLAVIQEELPNPRGGRGVVVVPPEDWQPNATFTATVLEGLSSGPVLSAVTVDRLFQDVAPTQQRQSTLVRGIAGPPPRNQLSDALAIRAARRLLVSMASILPPASPALDTIDRALLIAESADIGDRARQTGVGTVGQMIDRTKGVVSLPGNRSLTFTARQGRVPITLLSRASYPVRVSVRVSSQKLAFQAGGVPGGVCTKSGNAEVCTVELRNQDTTLRIPVVAKTAGVFTLSVTLESPDGGLTLASTEYTVRSTAASGVGIVLSVGAILLLAVWWGRNVRHGRRARQLIQPRAAGNDWLPAGPDCPPSAVLVEPNGGRGGGKRRPPAEVGRAPVAVGRVGEPESPPPQPNLVPPGALTLDPPSPTDPGPVESPAAATRLAPESPAGPPRPSAPPAEVPGRGLPPVAGGPPRPDPSVPRSAMPRFRPRRAPPPTPPAGPAGEGPAGDGGSFSHRTAVMAAGTLVSRLTGFGRVLALVWAFHFTRLADVYNVANTAPNILYDLVLGGVLSATLVPVFVDQLNRDDPDEGWRAISAVVTAITVALVLLSAAFWLAAPLIIRFYLVLNNSATAADQRAVGTTLLRLFVPQLFLLGGIAVTTALLNARRHFTVPAFSPVLNNVVVIVAIVLTRLVASDLSLPGLRHDQAVLLLLGFGTTAGYLVQFLVQLPPMVKNGLRLRPIWDLDHPAVRTVLRLSAWTFGSVLANQVAFNLILVLADKKTGDVTVFQTAYQFFQLPYAIFAVSIASVITPDLSQHWSDRDLGAFRRQMANGLRLTLGILLPAAVGYVVLAQPFLQLVFQHGSFSHADAHRIGTVVALFAVGLPGFSAYLLLMRGYQAMQDTKSMFMLYLVENLATLVLAGVLYPIMGVSGLALGWVSAYSIGSIVAFAHLRRRTGGLEGSATARGLARVVVASAVMAVPVIAFSHLFSGASGLVLLVEVAGGAAIGTSVYLGASRVLGIREVTSAVRSLRGHR